MRNEITDSKETVNNEGTPTELVSFTQENKSPEIYENEQIIDHVNEEENSKAPFIMTVEIDQGNSEKINIYYDSNPEELAFDFCKKYNLDYSALSYLINEIKSVLSKKNFPHHETNDPIEEVEEEENLTESKKNLNPREEKDESPDNQSEKCSNKSFHNSSNHEENVESQKNLNTEDILKTNETAQIEKPNKIDIDELANSQKSHQSRFKNKNNAFQNTNIMSTSHSREYTYHKTEETKQNSFDQKLFSYQLFIDSQSTSNSNKKKKEVLRNSHNSVHEKLYQDSKSKQELIRSKYRNIDIEEKSLKSNDEKPKIPNKLKINYTGKDKDCFYRLSNNTKLDKNKKIISRLNQDKIFTFQPKINDIPSYIKNFNVEGENPLTLEERFKYYLSKHDNKIKILKEQYKNNEEYDFHPKINPLSEKIVKAKYENLESEYDRNQEKFDRNHEFHANFKFKELRRKNLEYELNLKYSFQPRINNYNNIDFGTFQERNDYFNEKRKCDRAKLVEENTTLPSFTPKLYKCSISTKRNTGKIYENLYLLSEKMRKSKSSNLHNREVNFKVESNKIHTNLSSQRFYQISKYDSFKKIFNELDSDQDGIISTLAIDLRNTKKEVLSILEPVIKSIKENALKINFESFCTECENHFKILNLTQRKIIHQYSKDKKIDNHTQFSFQPQINIRSRVLDNEVQKKVLRAYSEEKGKSKNNFY